MEIPRGADQRETGRGVSGSETGAYPRAREEEDEFLQTVPQDDTMKERQAEVYFLRNPDMLDFSMRKEDLLCESAWRQQALQCVAWVVAFLRRNDVSRCL